MERGRALEENVGKVKGWDSSWPWYVQVCEHDADEGERCSDSKAEREREGGEKKDTRGRSEHY